MGNDKPCGEKFIDDFLNEEGLAFTKFYYLNAKGEYGKYLTDYQLTLGRKYDSLYEIPNTQENYDRMSKMISWRYKKWKKKSNSRWKFWKRK
ncbi:MAG: hypothetical protein ED557_14125 [Balneola sp.]|nr:MAG: hypothetical protein ED557_14125 [Balneola sp.]